MEGGTHSLPGSLWLGKDTRAALAPQGLCALSVPHEVLQCQAGCQAGCQDRPQGPLPALGAWLHPHEIAAASAQEHTQVSTFSTMLHGNFPHPAYI